MTGRTCDRHDCDRPHKAQGLCVVHYNRQRDRERSSRKRPDRILANRARGRAVTQLIRENPERFAELLAEITEQVQAEHARLVELAEEAGLDPLQGIVRLRPGPRPSDQEPEDRIDLSTTSSCNDCASFHRTGHSCTHCEDAAWEAATPKRTSTPLVALTPEQRIERAFRAGKSAAWIRDNLAEPMPAVMRVLDRMRTAS